MKWSMIKLTIKCKLNELNKNNIAQCLTSNEFYSVKMLNSEYNLQIVYGLYGGLIWNFDCWQGHWGMGEAANNFYIYLNFSGKREIRSKCVLNFLNMNFNYSRLSFKLIIFNNNTYWPCPQGRNMSIICYPCVICNK